MFMQPILTIKNCI